MKKQFKVLVAVVLTTMLSNLTFANTDLSKNQVDSKEFSTAVSKKAKKVAKKNAEDLAVFVSVNNLFETTPAAFYNLDEASQNRYFEACNNLNENFEGSKKKDLQKLSNQINYNKALSKFVWNSKKSLAVVKVPVAVTRNKETNI